MRSARLEDRYACAPTRALGAVDADDERSGLEDTTLPMPLFAGARLSWLDGASRRRGHPTRRFQDGSESGTEYTLGPMAGGYLRGDHESEPHSRTGGFHDHASTNPSRD